MRRSIDARALLDGRLPADWKAGDPIPDNADAGHPDSGYLANYYSSLLCTCAINYFRVGMSTYTPAPLLEKA
jgi:hypothetical protein